MSFLDRIADWWYKRVWVECKLCEGHGRIRMSKSGRDSTMVRVCIACKGLGKIAEKIK